MSQVHKKEKDQFKELFKQVNIDRFEERYQVLEEFLRTEKHITPEELTLLLNRNQKRFDPSFVRETLEMMRHYGFAHSSRFDNGQVRYEHRHLGHHHDHMICTKCRKIIEFEEPELEYMQAKVSGKYGFHMLQHKMEIYGICSDCLKERSRRMPLNLAPAGEKVVIRDFEGGPRLKMRMMSMGLRIGEEVEVISNMGTGQMVVAAGYSRFALGRGESNKIVVEVVER